MTHVIRCKLVCRSVQPVSNDPANPMSRATFGALWSESPASENTVFGMYTRMPSSPALQLNFALAAFVGADLSAKRYE